MKKKIILTLSLTLIAVVFCATAFAAAPEYTIRVGSICSDTHVDIVSLRATFVPLVENNSGGRIKVEVYPNGQLGSDREMTEAVQMGTLTIAIPATSAMAGFDKRLQVLDLPFLFTSREAAFTALDGDLGKKLSEYVSKKGFYCLAYMENGMRHVTNNKGPVTKPSDLKGIKIRTMENPMHIAYFKELGANPTPMSWGELYTALQQGVVDAEENPYAMIYDGKFNEVQKYVSETGHVFSPLMFVANKKFMDGLPEDLRKVVLDAAHEYSLAQRKMAADKELEYKKILVDGGMKANELTAAEKKPFVDATKNVYARFEKDLGKEIMDLARKYQK